MLTLIHVWYNFEESKASRLETLYLKLCKTLLFVYYDFYTKKRQDTFIGNGLDTGRLIFDKTFLSKSFQLFLLKKTMFEGFLAEIEVYLKNNSPLS